MCVSLIGPKLGVNRLLTLDFLLPLAPCGRLPGLSRWRPTLALVVWGVPYQEE
jgi:hypothetical protein